MHSKLTLLAWFVFFVSPCFTTNILDYFIATDLLAFACALTASAYIYTSNSNTTQSNLKLIIWLLIFLTPAFLSLTLSEPRNPWGVVKYSIYIAATYLIFRFMQMQSLSLINHKKWIMMLAIIGNFYAIIAIAQTFHLFTEDQNSLFAIFSYIPRFSGPLLQPNLTGLLLNIIVASLLIHLIRQHFHKIWLFASILPCSIIWVGNSRSAILLLLLIVITLFVLTKEKKQFLFYTLSMLGISFAIAWQWNMLLQSAGAQGVAIGSRLAGVGIEARLNLWYTSIDLFLQHPLLGIGYGNLASYFVEAQAYTHAQHHDLPSMAAATHWSHNILIQFFAEGGILAGFALLALLTWIVRRCWHILSLGNSIQSPYLPAIFSVTLVLIHGMVSISLYQGFFLCLFALYLAALFPANSDKEPVSTIQQNTPPFLQSLQKSMLFMPALYFFFTCYQFIHIQTNIRAVFNEDPDNPAFIAEVSKAINNPWLARSGLEYLFANMEMTHAPAFQWVNAYPLLYQHWLLTQEPLALKRLILNAHLSDNAQSEKYWGEMYMAAFPASPWNISLKKHIDEGHSKHEAFSLR
jgi:O-antigen ligase